MTKILDSLVDVIVRVYIRGVGERGNVKSSVKKRFKMELIKKKAILLGVALIPK